MKNSVQFNSLSPTIGVTNLEEAISFYQSLNFKLDWQWPDSQPSHASFSSDAACFLVVVSKNNEIPKADLYFTVSDVKSLYEYYSGKGITTSKLVVTEYGMEDFSLNDPWGHHFVFGQPVNQEKNSKLNPFLNEGSYIFYSGKLKQTPEVSPLCTFHEEEGLTQILSIADAKALKIKTESSWAWITLGLNTDLEMVGLTSLVSTALAKQNIPCNIVAAFYHDHIFVPMDNTDRALEILNALKY